MGETLQSVSGGWADGVNTTVPADQVPAGGSPRARNTALVNVAPGVAAVRKRKGLRTMNTTAVTGSAPFIGQTEFRHLASGVFANYHLALTDTGRVEHVSTAGTLTNVSTGLTSGTYYPAFAQANNCCFIVNGQDRKKVTIVSAALVLQDFGITAPSSAPSLADAGSGSFHNGTYEGRVTYLNGNTGEESSAGTTSSTVTLTNNAINWTSIPVSADTQVTARKLYLRNTATMNQFYLAATISDNSTTSTSTDLLDTALIIAGPDTDANNRPPSGVKYVAWHRNRMLVADDEAIYYSRDGHPEAFDAEAIKYVNRKDGQKLTGIWALNEDTLLIGKTHSMYVLRGADPETWVLDILFQDVGVTSHMSLTIVDGVARWWSPSGPVEWDQSGAPVAIGQLHIDATIGESGINYARLSQIQAAPDHARQRVVWAVPESGQTRNTKLLPYSTRLRRWESDGWDPMDTASLGVATDSSGFLQLYLGGYSGQIFRLWDTENDGVPSGTMTGTFVAAATSVSTVTDLTAAFNTTGAGLIERKVTILDANGRMVGSTRPRVTANTATALTLSASVSGLAIGDTYTYTVGGPAYELDTHWEAFGLPFTRKRWEFLYFQSEASISSTVLYIDVAFDLDTNNRRGLTFTSPAGAVWGTFLWGYAVWGGITSALKRLRLAKTGVKARARFFNYYPNQSFTLYRAGFRAEALGDKGLM